MDNFDDIIVAIGSGGTACGLALANHLTGSKLKYAISNFSCNHLCIHHVLYLRIHAVCVCDDAAHFHEAINAILVKLGLSEGSEGRPAMQSRDILDIIEGYKGRGYALSTDEELGIAIKRLSMFPSSLRTCFFLPHFSSVGGNFFSNWHHS